MLKYSNLQNITFLIDVIYFPHATVSKMGRSKKGYVKLTCRIWPEAKKKLAKEAANIKSARPLYGQLISRLIHNCSDHGWAEIMQNFPLKSGNHRQAHYRRMREKIDNPDW
jgi:hypothetical protein